MLTLLTSTYNIPAYIDNENSPIIATVNVNGVALLPSSFITFTAPTTFSFAPLAADAGIYTIDVTISDTQLQSIGTFQLTVNLNIAPLFSVEPLVNQQMSLNKVLTYTIPTYSDPSG